MVDVVMNFDRSRDGNLENFHGPKLRVSSGILKTDYNIFNIAICGLLQSSSEVI